jgi:hypothetical protein
MIYRPRVPSIFDRADVFHPGNRDLRGLWCLQSGHYRDYSQYQAAAVSASNPGWTPNGVQWNSNGYIDLGDKEQYRYAEDPAGITCEAIFTLDQHVNGEFPRIFSKLSSGAFAGYELLVRSPDEATFVSLRRCIYLQIGNAGSLGQFSGAEIFAGRKHHVIVTKAASSAPNVYVDGVLNNTGVFGTTSTGATSTPLVIGAWGGALTNGIRGTVEKVAIYGRELSSGDVQRMFQDPYWHFSTRRNILLGFGQSPFFDWDLSPECSYELPAQSAHFDCDASLECTWDAPQPSSFWQCDLAPGAEFTGHVGAVGRFDASVDISAEFQGRVRGAVHWEADLSLQCSWIVGAKLVKKDCLAGDGRFAAVSGDIDLEQNYVF